MADALRPGSRDLLHERTGLRLDEGGQHGLRPDLSLWSGDECVFVGDCKYKSSADAQARRDDVFQALAYAAATGLPSVTLIYGGDADSGRDLRIVDGRTTVRVRTVDLSSPAQTLRARFSALAAEIGADADAAARRAATIHVRV